MASDNSGLEKEVAGSMGSMTATTGVFEGKKIRKPYTITKSRESWSDEEHDRFIKALRCFKRDWKRIEAFVGTKSAIQIRSHAQKYFLKVQKHGTGEHVPPPRPKRKSVNPYPRKEPNAPLALLSATAFQTAPVASQSATAFQTAPLASQSATAFQASSYLLDLGYTLGSDSSIMLSPNSACPYGMRIQKENIMPPIDMTVNNCYGSSEIPISSWPICQTNAQRSQVLSVPAKPAIAQLYNFIGSIFDPNSSGHLQKLKELDPAVINMILPAMRNLSINLTSPGCEAYRKVLVSYAASSAEVKLGNAYVSFQANETASDSFNSKR